MKNEFAKQFKVTRDICQRSYTLEHFWRDGAIYNPLKIWKLTFPNIYWGKPILEVRICSACGITDEKEVKYEEKR